MASKQTVTIQPNGDVYTIRHDFNGGDREAYADMQGQEELMRMSRDVAVRKTFQTSLVVAFDNGQTVVQHYYFDTKNYWEA